MTSIRMFSSLAEHLKLSPGVDSLWRQLQMFSSFDFIFRSFASTPPQSLEAP